MVFLRITCILILAASSLNQAFSFDEVLLLQSWTSYNYTDDQWIPVNTYTYSYDSKNRKSMEVRTIWDSVEWRNDIRTFFYYDENGNMKEEKTQFWQNYFQNWMGFRRLVYDYDTNGNLSETITQFYNDSTWEIYSRDLNTYNEKNLRTSFASQWWDNGQWMDREKIIYDYFENDSLKIQTNYTGFHQNPEGTPKTRTLYTYKYGEIEILKQDFLNDEFENSLLHTLTYNDDLKIVESVYSDWNKDKWKYNTKYIYHYTDFGEPELRELLSWENNSWENDGLSIYNYDDNQELIEYRSQIWKNGEWQNSYKYIYSYKIVNSAPDEISVGSDLQVSTAPNPFSGIVKISYYLPSPAKVTLRIADQLGNVIHTANAGLKSEGNHEFAFDGNNVSSGMYYCILTVNGISKVVKLIKIE